MRKKSIKAVANKALNEDKKLRISSTTKDSFTNFAQKMGIGADNPLSTASYGFNPITRVRTLLEWIHRGSWIGGVAVDVIADDMTREGVEFEGELAPEDIAHLHKAATRLNIQGALRDTVAWSRLYGGCIALMLIEGQDVSTPLRLDTVGNGQFKGLLVLDRWMVEPSLSNLVTEMGPHLGLPKFYTVRADAPALPHMKIHYSRVVRLEGIRLPYWQRVMEQLWGISVLERVYDRMVAFDSATTGAAQLVHKAFIRTYKIKDMREIVSEGGPAMDGLVKYTEMMRRFQGIEGITLMDAEDEYEGHEHGAFGGLSDALVQFGQQVSGALQIPLVRLFGQSPAGFSTGDTDLRNYYDNIKQQQERELGVPIDTIYRCLAASEGIQLPDGFGVAFRSLWQLTDEQKANIAQTDSATITTAESNGTIDRATALRELKQSSRITGRFTNITEEMIKEAEGEMAPEASELLAEGERELANAEKAKAEAEIAISTDAAMKAAGVMFENDGKILLLKRSAEGDCEGQWAFPGGKIENGESSMEAAARECDEEIGHSPRKLQMLSKPCSNSENEVDYTTYHVEAENQFIPKLNDEHTAFAWVSPSEANKLNLHKGVRKFLAEKGYLK